MKTQSVRKLKLPPLDVEMLKFPLGRHISNGAPGKIAAPTGDPKEVELFRTQIDRFNVSLGHFARVPFAWPLVTGEDFGDFTGIHGHHIFKSLRGRLVGAVWSKARLGLARELLSFSKTSQALRFYGGDRCACIHGIRMIEGSVPELTIGVAPYETVFAGINSQGLRFNVSREQLAVIQYLYGTDGVSRVAALKKLVARLRKRFGDCTIRKVLFDYYKGELPPFGSPFIEQHVGMAVLVTTADGYVVVGQRTPGNVSVNVGINVPSSGGFQYSPDEIEAHGLSTFIETETRRELREELGIPGNMCTVNILALVREVPRAGAPDFIGFVEFHGKLRELVELARNNPFPNLDVDTLYAIPQAQAREMIVRPNITDIIHPKAVLALILWHRYLSIR